jgi:hypothetical protein
MSILVDLAQVHGMMQFLPHAISRLDAVRRKVAAACPPGFEQIYRSAWTNRSQPVATPSCDCVLRVQAAVAADAGLVPSAGTSLVHPVVARDVGGGARDFFRSAWPAWSNYPRQARAASRYRGTAYCRGHSAGGYGALVGAQLRRALEDVGGATSCACATSDPRVAAAPAAVEWRRLVVTNAWNEWGEQAVMEPTAEAGDAMLAAHRAAIGVLEAEVAVAAARARAEALNFSV